MNIGILNEMKLVLKFTKQVKNSTNEKQQEICLHLFLLKKISLFNIYISSTKKISIFPDGSKN